LLESAATYLVRIGPPAGNWPTPRYSVRETLDGGGGIHDAGTTKTEKRPVFAIAVSRSLRRQPDRVWLLGLY